MAIARTGPAITAARTPVLKVMPPLLLAAATAELELAADVPVAVERAPDVDLLILLVNVLAKELVKVVVWTVAVMAVVYDDVQTEYTLESSEGGGV
jgi:hypothetical protein